jgi:hypothetical protein
MIKKKYHIGLFILLTSCAHTVNVKNEYAGNLTATHQLAVSGEKKNVIDAETATKPIFMQMFKDSSGVRMLTFLNKYNSSIYFYDYAKGRYIRKTGYEREGPDAVLRPEGYYIKNMDSIYVFNLILTEVDLTDSAGHVKSRIPLQDGSSNWFVYYPQYMLSTVVPLIEIQGKLILTGLSPFSIPDSLINKFRFMAYIDMKTSQTEFVHTYPEELYGSNTNWEGGLATMVYPELSPDGELIHSFPVSHDLYITDKNTEACRTVYAGSNVTGTVHSIDREPRGTPDEIIVTHYLQKDWYAAIRYDPWRKVYYRFMIQGIPNATSRTPIHKKPVIIILMDEQFNYLGETLIGTGEEWNWTNSFVTEEGLNIEYIDMDDLEEDYLNLKIFTIEKL